MGRATGVWVLVIDIRSGWVLRGGFLDLHGRMSMTLRWMMGLHRLLSSVNWRLQLMKPLIPIENCALFLGDLCRLGLKMQ